LRTTPLCRGESHITKALNRSNRMAKKAAKKPAAKKAPAKKAAAKKAPAKKAAAKKK